MPRKFNKKFSEMKPIIKFLYNYRCYLCSKGCISLDVHHIDCDHTNNDAFNLLPLCKGCHKVVHLSAQRYTLGHNSTRHNSLVKLNEISKNW